MIYQVKGTPSNKVELLEVTGNGKVRVRKLDSQEIIETTQQAFEMAFEPIEFSLADYKNSKTPSRNQKIAQKDNIDTEEILTRSQTKIVDLFGKSILVAVQLPNGFILTESSSCLDLLGDDIEQTIHHCLELIKKRIEELEGYKHLAD